MILPSPADPLAALTLVLRLGSVGVAIASLELLSRPADLDGGMLDGEVQLTRSPGLVRHARAVGWLGAPRSSMALVVLRFAAACALIGGAGVFEVARAGSILVAATTLLLRIRSPIGMHASGSAVAVTFTAAALGLIVGTRPAIASTLGFIGAEACLAYLVAGISKLREPRWRSGQAVMLVASTLMWGDRRQALLLRDHPRMGTAVCWATIIGECSAPLAIVAPLPVALAILAVAIAFHISVAVQMGLNGFVWAFASTFPAIIFCNSWLHGHL